MSAAAPARGHDEAGLSLVETLIALAIIAAMTAGLATIAIDDARARAAMRAYSATIMSSTRSGAYMVAA